jgi:hypothetical protein
MDAGNATVRGIRGNGVVRTVAGRARAFAPWGESIDGPPDVARFTFQSSAGYGWSAAATDSQGNAVVAEPLSHVIRKITPTGLVSTLAGVPGVQGSQDGLGPQARFSFPAAVAIGPDDSVYVADGNNHIIRRIDVSGSVRTVAGSAGVRGTADGLAGDARFNAPSGLAFGADGALYVSELENDTIRRIDASGRVTTVAGAAKQAGRLDGVGADARFDHPRKLAAGRDGNLYAIDGYASDRVRRVTLGGAVSTPSDDWKNSLARRQTPGNPFSYRAVIADADGSVVVVNWDRNNTIWRISRDGVVSVVAGDTDWPGVPSGPLPGRLDQADGLAWIGSDEVLFTSGNSVFVLSLR